MRHPALLLLCALLLAGPTLAETVTVQSCNRQVSFAAPPKRAVSNDINLTEMMLALGLQNSMAGYTGISGWHKITPELRQQVGGLPQLAEKYPSLEVLLGANADFYFAGWNYGMTVGGEVTPDTLAPFGIKVYELTESCAHVMQRERASLEDVYNDLRNLSRIFRVEERAEALIRGYQERLQAVRQRLAGLERPLRVFVYDSGEDRPFTAGRLAMPTALIEAAGGRNIVDDVEASWTRIGWEPVVERDPEVVVIIDYGEVTAAQKIGFMKHNPALKELTAVQRDRFVVLPYDAATPGVRNIAAIETLARAFHPERFR